MRWIGPAVGLALAVSGSACVRTPGPADVQAHARPAADPFAYEHRPFRWQREPLDIESGEAWRVSRVEIPAADEDDPANPTAAAVVREPRGEARGLVVVLPVLSGDYGPADGFARALGDAGFTTLRLERKQDLFDPAGDFSLVARRFRQSVVDLRRLLDWAEDVSLPGSERIGLVGISMGSTVGTLAAASDARIQATVLVMGGAHLVELLEAARLNGAVEPFLTGLEERGWDRDRIQREAHAELDGLDPAAHAGALDPTTTLLLQGRFDDVIPMQNADALWEAAGRPERVVLPVGHYSAWMLLPYLHSRTVEFMEEQLAREE